MIKVNKIKGQNDVYIYKPVMTKEWDHPQEILSICFPSKNFTKFGRNSFVVVPRPLKGYWVVEDWNQFKPNCPDFPRPKLNRPPSVRTSEWLEPAAHITTDFPISTNSGLSSWLISLILPHCPQLLNPNVNNFPWPENRLIKIKIKLT